MSARATNEVTYLRARITALEELLDEHERTVTEQSERLERQRRELQRSNESLEQFAYVISHDLQEPLRMVAAYTQLLVEHLGPTTDEKVQKYVNFASGGAKRMQELINALLDYSRVSSRPRKLTDVDLDSVFDDVLRNLELAINDAKAEVLCPRGAGKILADRSQLLQLFQNLVANALKFRRSGEVPRIEIAVKRVEPGVEIRVSDNGIGIDPKFHNRIFEVFERLDPKRYPGTGIGLSVARKIAHRHGGDIAVESTPGVGTTFVVKLSPTEEKR